MITIVLAEDHHLVRQGLKYLLEAERDVRLVGETGDGVEALELVEKLRPKLLLLDLMIPKLHGLDVIRNLAEKKQTKIIVVSMHSDEPYVVEALKNGVAGYVLKDSSPADLIQAVRTVAEGGVFLSLPIRKCALGASLRRLGRPSPDTADRLTLRERLVLELAAEGLTNATIAHRLYISRRTVESHRASLMHKLGFKSQTDLVRYAIRKKIIEV